MMFLYFECLRLVLLQKSIDSRTSRPRIVYLHSVIYTVYCSNPSAGEVAQGFAADEAKFLSGSDVAGNPSLIVYY